MSTPEAVGPLINITDQQYPDRGMRDLAAKLALDAGKHVHFVEEKQIYCLLEVCPYGGNL